MPAPTTTTTTTTTTTAAPGPWICTPLLAGPLGSNSYSVTIPGLLASTCYQYRSVFTVSGTCYCGNILEGATQPPVMSIPVVTTGIAPHPALTDGYFTCGHTVDDNGNLTIQEYGILYTANPSYNGDATLVCTNLPTNVVKSSVCGSISEAVPYSAMTTGLPSNTTTYYRAFAVNAVGVGYGCIYSKITATPPLPTVHIAAPTWTWSPDLTANNVVTITGTATITARGTIWSLTGNPQFPVTGAWTNYPPFTTGVFTAQMHCSALYGPGGSGTGYWFYRAYACTPDGVAYSPEIYTLNLG